jgi:excisionase family DNA binding protein
MSDSFKSHVTVSEMAKAMGVSLLTVDRWTQLGKIPPPVVVGRHRIYRLAAVVEALGRVHLQTRAVKKLNKLRMACIENGHLPTPESKAL